MRNKGVSHYLRQALSQCIGCGIIPLCAVYIMKPGREEFQTLLSINIYQGSQNPNRIIRVLLASQTHGFGFYVICVLHVFGGESVCECAPYGYLGGSS